MGVQFKILACVFTLTGALFALDFALPPVTSELKENAHEYFQNECRGCHRWGRKFAAPPMHDNVEHYLENPEAMVKYLMHPTPQHPDVWPAMEITPLTEEQAKMMTAWLIYVYNNPDDESRPK